MESLPEDLLFNILSWLDVRSILQCQCVSKKWRSITLDPFFTHTHLSRCDSARTNHDILFTFSPKNMRGSKNLCIAEPTRNNDPNPYKELVSIPTELNYLDNTISSCNGFLLLVRQFSRDFIRVWNPWTSEIFNLPMYPRPIQYVSYLYDSIAEGFVKREVATVGFGFDKVSREYKVVVVESGPEGNKGCICTISGTTGLVGSWRNLEGVVTRNVHGVFLDGNIHWLIASNREWKKRLRIVSFNVREERFEQISEAPQGLRVTHWLDIKVLGGCLSIIGSNKKCIEIWVMKGDSWMKEYVIKLSLKSWIEILGVCRNGEILMEWGRDLAVYDPRRKALRMCKIRGPFHRRFTAMPYIGSLALLKNSGG